MKLTGDFQVGTDPAVVVSALVDPETIGRCLPGCQSVERRADDGVNVVVLAGVGLVRGRMRFRLQVHAGPPAPAAVVSYKASGSGLGSQVDVDACFTVTPATGGSHLAWSGEARVGGTLASIGAGLLEGAAKQNIHTLVDNIRAELQKRAG